MRSCLPFFIALAVGCAAPADDVPVASDVAGEEALPPASPAGASGGRLLPAQAAFDVEHYRLDIEVDPEQRHIDGRLAMTARVVTETDRLALHLDERLVVSEVTVQGEVRSHAHSQGLVRVNLPEPLPAGGRVEMVVAYAGNPREAPRAPWDGGFTWAETGDGSPWITTTCQGEGGDLWWPCKDHPSDKPESMDLFVTVPEPLVCASNGTLRSVQGRGDGTQTFHWHIASPISNYNVALNIGPYTTLETEYESVAGHPLPVIFWVLPESVEQGKAFLPQIVDHLRFFEETLGPYPFRAEKYGVVETPHLGMEHQTIIAYGNQFREDGTKPGYDWLHHHELSHEWWGNLVTCRDWKDMWIHEGIGSYMQVLYLEQKFGAETAQRELAGWRARLNNKRAVAPRESQDSKQIYFLPDGGHDNDIYSKGAWVLHTLRWYLGDDIFRLVLRRLAYPDPALEEVTDGSQVRFTDTDAVLALAEEVSERELGWFFDVYLRQPELPELVTERLPTGLQLAWKVPGDLPFPMPVPVSIDGVVRRLELSDRPVHVPIAEGTEVIVDPEQWLLRFQEHAEGEVRLAP